MLKINKSILIICMISLFLIIGQISASDTDSIEINDTDTIHTIECELNANALSSDENMNEGPNDSNSPNHYQETEILDEIGPNEFEDAGKTEEDDHSNNS